MWLRILNGKSSPESGLIRLEMYASVMGDDSDENDGSGGDSDDDGGDKRS